MQQFLKPAPGAARAEVVPAQLFGQFLVGMDNAVAALDISFRREPFAALAAGFAEKSSYSLQSLLPDGFARHITEVSCSLIIRYKHHPPIAFVQLTEGRANVATIPPLRGQRSQDERGKKLAAPVGMTAGRKAGPSHRSQKARAGSG